MSSYRIFTFSIKKSCLGPKKQDLLSKINIGTQRKPLYFSNSVTESSLKMKVHKKLGMILENKVFQKLKKRKQKKCAPKLLFLIEKY